ncbi:hypothetical protein QQF64_006511 [Cirrhinus molitorella]|uniref:C2H2-type domain-containing protein n=1 Tax=Cirrhinus molitorella TaxID=172907 RepID=A0ABR3M812_9TELE
MHRTVLRHEKIALQRCQSCSNYHCPFCGPDVFKPTMELHIVENHVSNHLSLAVQHEEFLIAKCNLKCREQGQFFTVLMPKHSYTGKFQIVKHLAACKKRQVPANRNQTLLNHSCNMNHRHL